MEWQRMFNVFITLMVTLAVMLPAGGPAHAQSKSSSKMYCWKNKSGKTECGDTVPYEYQESGIREMNRQGIVTKRSETFTPEERKAREAIEDKRRAETVARDEQRRKDKALLDTFSNEKEIDLKRVRDVQLIESTIETLQGNLKNNGERAADVRARMEPYNKDKRPVPPHLLDEMERVNAEKMQTERLIAQKRKEILALHQLYDGLKKRFAELAASDTPKKGTPQ
jgi:hypothetical protein